MKIESSTLVLCKEFLAAIKLVGVFESEKSRTVRDHTNIDA